VAVSRALEQSGFDDEVSIMNLVQTKELSKHFYDKINTVSSDANTEGII
jgi:hypothetical protein